MFSTCFGQRSAQRDPEREPLLPQYDQDTDLQRQAHQKLHSYQMVRALTRGYMPSTEQTIINLRTLLASDLLNPDDTGLSESGRKLARLTKQLIEQFIALLRDKNNDDQLQDIIWFLANSHISVDANDLHARLRQSKSKADTDAAYQSLRTLSSLLLTNPNFRVFLEDLNTVGREIFSDSAYALSEASRQAASQVEPTVNDKKKAKQLIDDSREAAPSGETLEDEFRDVGKAVVEGGAEVAQTTVESAENKLSGDEGKALLSRLKQAVLSLRNREDYESSVSTLSVLVKRYATVYSRAAEEVIGAAQEDINENEETDRAVKKLWGFIQTFGDMQEWKKCEDLLKKLVDDQKHDPEFENFIQEVGDSLQNLLTDPDFFEDAPAKLKELREKSKQVGKESSLRRDVDLLLSQLSTTLTSVANDQHIRALTTTTKRLATILFPTKKPNSDLLHDISSSFLPLLISAIQKLPIPRLEVSTPAIDLLLENLVLEPPRRTVNRSSFLPHRFRIESHNDIEIRAVRPEARDSAPTIRSRPPATSQTTHRLSLRLDGLTAQATDVGFWLRARGGPLSLLFPLGLSDEGLASLVIDKRGLDIRLELDVSPSSFLLPLSSSSSQHPFSIRQVRVRVHNLEYKLHRSKVSWLVGWLARPFLRAILRKLIEKKISQFIVDSFRGLEKEIIMARERVRGADAAAGKADPWGWIKAVFLGRRSGGGGGEGENGQAADSWSRVGVDEPGRGVFKGVYAPGSLIKVWKEQEERERQRREREWDREGWRSTVFDVPIRGGEGEVEGRRRRGDGETREENGGGGDRHAGGRRDGVNGGGIVMGA